VTTETRATRSRVRIVRPRVSRRTIGKSMIAVGIAGIIIGLTTVVAGQRMISQVETSVDDSLRLTGEALSAVTDSIAVTGSVVDSVRTGMTNIRTTMATVETSLGQGSTALKTGSDFLGGSLPQALDAVNGVLPTIQSVTKSIDDTLRLLNRVPFGPTYAPVQPLDESIGRLSTALKPLPDELRTLGGSFASLEGSTSTMAVQIAQLGKSLDTLNTQLADVGRLLARYSSTAIQAKLLAQSSRHDLSRSADLTRLWLIVLGLVFALGQIVPIWLGSVLLSGDSVGSTVIMRARDSGETDSAGDIYPS
jgi:hypothetical protein